MGERGLVHGIKPEILLNSEKEGRKVGGTIEAGSKGKWLEEGL